MSRVLTAVPETFVRSQSSPAITAFTFAAWIKPTTALQNSTIFVKDPATYRTFMELFNGALFASAGGADPQFGGVSIGNVTDGGSGYGTHDTGDVVATPPSLGQEATYIVNLQAGGVAATLGFPGNGAGFKVGDHCTTTPGGSQPGVGSGLAFDVAAINNSGQSATSQGIEVVAPNVWTHVAMTWDSAGDGKVRLYINGVECTYTGAQVPSKVADSSTDPYYIGDDSFGFGFTGPIAEAVFYSTALSGAQIAALAASTSGATGSPTDYFHLCGSADPEPNAANPTNFGTLSVPPPAQGGDSPGYTCGGPPPPATAGTMIDNPNRCCSRTVDS